MYSQHVGKLLSAALILLGCSARAAQQPQIAALVTNLFISETVFLSIQGGASFDTVTNTLKDSSRHGFTISETNGVYTMISCLVAVGDGIDFWLLFHNRALLKIVHLPRREVVIYPYRGTTASRIRPWDIEDKTYIEKTINAQAMTHDQIRAYLDWVRPDERTAGEPANIGPAFVLSGYFNTMRSRIKKDYETNQELRKRYDSGRANLGMSVEQVDDLYGKPLRTFVTTDSRPVRVYGESRRLEIDPRYRFSCVATIFDSQRRLAAIYGYGFFDDAWAEGANTGIGVRQE